MLAMCYPNLAVFEPCQKISHLDPNQTLHSYMMKILANKYYNTGNYQKLSKVNQTAETNALHYEFNYTLQTFYKGCDFFEKCTTPFLAKQTYKDLLIFGIKEKNTQILLKVMNLPKTKEYQNNIALPKIEELFVAWYNLIAIHSEKICFLGEFILNLNENSGHLSNQFKECIKVLEVEYKEKSCLLKKAWEVQYGCELIV